MKKFLNTLPIALLASVMLIGCAGEDGSDGVIGDTGPQGPAGPQGLSALVSTTALDAGDANCANGGIQIDVGLDANADGTLDAGEITDTQFVCNGNAGAGVLVNTTTLEAGAECSNGGIMLEIGVDTDGSGTLEAGEVTSTQYICNGEGAMDYTYVGSNAVTCGSCHSGTVEDWMGSGHAHAMEGSFAETPENLENPYCLQCHTTGWDTPIAYGQTEFDPTGADNSGYDDFYADDSAEGAARRAALEGVQCEACHGNMGPGIYDHNPEISFASRIENEESLAICGSCHHGQMEEWNESGHSRAIENEGSVEEFTSHFGRTSCWSCHTSEGFVATYDADWAGILPSDFETLSQVGCVTCHDPHVAADEESNPAQLREGALVEYTVLYDPEGDGPTYSGMGNSQLCVQCHHGRRDTANVQGQIDNGYAHFGPHYSNQMDMWLGAGSYEIEGYTYDRQYMHNNQDGSMALGCVNCHFPLVEEHGRDHMVHNLEINWESCNACHGDAEAFVAGIQAEIETLSEELLVAIGEPADSLGLARLSPEQRMAGYAYAFVHEDASHGIHNPAYATSLLQNAIDFISAE
jgi:formate-dependent nitrite reductase cytochrome c552 subunit